MIICVPSRKYHWKLKIVKSSHSFPHINIGIIEADEAMTSKSEYWWLRAYGYSYFTDGDIYHVFEYSHYGPRYGSEGDIIDVYLDLTQNNNYIAFGKNDEKFGKAFNVESDTNYKLAVGLNPERDTIVRLLSLDVGY